MLATVASAVSDASVRARRRWRRQLSIAAISSSLSSPPPRPTRIPTATAIGSRTKKITAAALPPEDWAGRPEAARRLLRAAPVKYWTAGLPASLRRLPQLMQ